MATLFFMGGRASATSFVKKLHLIAKYYYYECHYDKTCLLLLQLIDNIIIIMLHSHRVTLAREKEGE